MANLAEGFERRSPAEFHHFLAAAQASYAEGRSQLHIARDVGHLTEHSFTQLPAQAEEVDRIVGGLCNTIARHRPTR